MTTNLLRRYEREQGQMLLAVMSTTPTDEHTLPEIDLTRLLARMDVERLTRKGSR